MGSSVSKSKKNRQSTSSLPSKKTRKTRPRSVSEVSIPQNPQQWSYETNINNNKNNVNDNITSTSAFVDDSRSTPFKKLTRNHQRTSGNNNSPNPDNTSQPRTSTSNGRPSFSLLRGRKSNQLQRGQNDYTDDDGPQRKPILHISAPIIEPSDTAEGGTLLPSFPDAPPPRHRPRPSVEVNQYQPNQYVEPSRSSSSGAYKAKVPALPISAQFATIASPSTTPLLSDIPSFPLPPTTISTPPLTSGSLLSQSPHLEDSQRLWRESLRNAAEGRKSESGLVRSNSNNIGCGVGLWMKDMALEFPLTEVHGVDLVVPTRRRRPRVNAPLATSSPTKSSFSDKTSDQHSSIQSASSAGSVHHSSSGYPYATPPSTSSPAMLDSMPSNCFFHKADITQCLPFADNTFDYCHIQLVLWGYQLNAFPNLLDEMIRVTKKDGWIEFVDMDPCLKKTTETGTRINEWIKTGLIHSNMDPDLVKTLPKFLKEYCEAIMPQEPKTPSVRDSDLLQVFGLDRLKISKVSLPFGPWGGKVGELWQQNFTSFLKELEPMMVDATLSGLIMDQYHRLCLDEMQQMAAEASRLSGSAGAGERITSFDHRICTHKAWMHLIHQLLTDASYSLPSTDANATKSSKTAPSSPSTNMSSSIKEMRSYNNFYLIHAQKVDLMELKQQILLQKLEQSILSPSLGETGATFTSQAPSLLSAIQQPANQEEPFSQQTSTLFDKLSLSGPKKPIIYPKHGQEVASLTEDALENFNKINGGTSRSIRDGSVSNVMTAGSFAPPAPTSVAALSIRSSSRMSNNNSTNGDIKNQNNLPGTPGSITSSGCHSPRAEATVARAMSYLRREGSVKSGLGSPQPQSQPQSASESEANNNSNNKGFVPDYFNQVPVNNPASYHQQQYNHHFQQQMNVIKRKPSLLNQVLAPSVEAQRNKDRAEKGVLEEEGDESNVAATEVQDAASERTSSSVAQTDDADSSVILISLEDEGVPDDESEETQMGVSGAITGHAQSDNDDNTIEIFNRISEDGEEKEEEEDNGELQMLVLDDEEVFVMLAPDSHRGSLQEGSAQQGVSTMDVMVPQEALEVRPVEESADEEELDTKVDPVSELASNAPATESTPTVPVAPEESSSAKRWSVDPEETEQDGDDGTSAAPSEIGDGDQDVEGGDVDEEKARSNGAHPAGSDATVADAHKAKSKKSKAKKGRKH
ncbi:hypothetical protein BGZ52_003677 [Haplosporangium bisporale]|nr:hypothetical protein BGZ52_003677 [Haplosporangium bisporale]